MERSRKDPGSNARDNSFGGKEWMNQKRRKLLLRESRMRRSSCVFPIRRCRLELLRSCSELQMLEFVCKWAGESSDEGLMVE